MANNLGGVNGIRSLPLPPGAPVRPAEPSRAVVPATEVTQTPRESESPLGRSGLSALDVLLTSDLVVEREPVALTALEMGLESARGALLRQQPGEALAALDAVWSRASMSEEGWYLRAGALILDGQLDESDRVADDGLERAPTSMALRFVQSVSRLLSGDVQGARAALLQTLDATLEHPVLLAQHAILQARQGRGGESGKLLQHLSAQFPEHPATQWAEGEVRAIRSMRAREASSSGDFEVIAEPSLLTDAAESAAAISEERALLVDSDAGESAFARLGVRLAVGGRTDAIEMARMLIRAFTTGGALSSSVLPEQAHGARSVLIAIVNTLRQDARAPGAALVRQVVEALRDGRTNDIARLIAREGRTVPYPQRRWIAALLREVAPTVVVHRDTPTHAVRVDAIQVQSVRVDETGDDARESLSAVLSDARATGPHIPVRLGLGLLSDSAAARQAAHMTMEELRIAAEYTATASDLARVPTPADGRAVAAGLSAPGVTYTPGGRPAPLDAGMLLPPLVAMAAAVIAAANGARVVALAAVAIGIWLAFRRQTVTFGPVDARAPKDRGDVARSAVRRRGPQDVGDNPDDGASGID